MTANGTSGLLHISFTRRQHHLENDSNNNGCAEVG